jgi:glycosyltransferase involved in cell wall biosynthesis
LAVVFRWGDADTVRTAETLTPAAVLGKTRRAPVYRPDNVEDLLHYYLEHEEERAELADAARVLASRCRFEDFWEGILSEIEPLVPVAGQRCRTGPGPEETTTRCWQALQSSRFEDADLIGALEKALGPAPQAKGAVDDAAAALHNALGVMVGRQALGRGTAPVAAEMAVECFRRALARRPGHVLAGLNLAEALAAAGQQLAAIEAARRTLEAVQCHHGGRPPEGLDGLCWGRSFDVFAVEWERAAWSNAGQAAAEAEAKLRLVRWRLHALLAQWSEEPSHAYEAAMLRPDLPASRAALGFYLLKANRPGEALSHLRQAVADNPLDRAAARACFGALGQLGDGAGQKALAEEQQRLYAACAPLLPPEPWFVPAVSRNGTAGRNDVPAAAAPRPAGTPGGQQNGSRQRFSVVWEGGVEELHSLALVNRQFCLRLLERGHEVSIWPQEFPLEMGVPSLSAPPALLQRFRCPLERPCDVHVRHRWPPDFAPPPAGHWVLIQPWEFGSLPRDWVQPIADLVDEVWAYTRAVRDCYIVGGIPEDRVHVVPLGVDAAQFRAGVPPFPLKTRRRCKFLFVGGTISRKGFDLLLEVYARTFTAADDVCLVVKDMGVGTFYRDQTGEEAIAALRARADAPEVEYLDQPLREEELPGLYAACDCLVLPYRGEGFGLPVLEAMACGLPVIVTGQGAAADYCDESRAYLLAAQVRPLERSRVGDKETVGQPWLLEPDAAALADALLRVAGNPEEARAKGVKASAFVREQWTWEHAAEAVERRLEALRHQPVRRLQQSGGATVPAVPLEKANSLCMIVRNEEHHLPDCLKSVQGLFADIVVVDTGSTDRTREVAESFGARVMDFPWPDSFGAARNESLRHARGKWILWLDADDRLDAENRKELESLLANLGDERDAYAMKVRSVLDPQRQSFRVLDQVRLFRNLPSVRWDYRIHEQILPAVNRAGGGVRWANVVIDHVGYQDSSKRRGKLERNLRLLEMDYADRPEDGFTLFNLGWTLLDLGRTEEALTHLRTSLEKTSPSSSTLRKLYHLLTLAYRALDRKEEALAKCAEGLERFPFDAELLFEEGMLRRDRGDLRGAEKSWLSLLDSRRGQYFASEDVGLRGFRTRQLLAEVYRHQDRRLEAEVQWRAALAERPDFEPAWMGLAELYLGSQRWTELEYFLQELEERGRDAAKVDWLRARGQAQRQEWAAARRTLAAAIARDPKALGPRLLLSQVLLHEGRDWTATERALRAVLEIDPNHAETQHNLALLLRRLGRQPVA